MLQVLGLETAVTNADKRYIKKLNGISVPPEVFSVAAEALKATMVKGDTSYESRTISIFQAVRQLEIDNFSNALSFHALTCRVEALNHIFHGMSEQEFASLNDDYDAMYDRIVAAAVSEPLIPVVQDGLLRITFDLSSFRKALMREGGLVA